MPKEGLSSLLHKRHWNVIFSKMGDMRVTSFFKKYNGRERRCWEQCWEKRWRANKTIIKQSQNQMGTKTRNQLHWVRWSSWRTSSIRNTNATNHATSARCSKAMIVAAYFKLFKTEYLNFLKTKNSGISYLISANFLLCHKKCTVIKSYSVKCFTAIT